ncbi:MAG TPA: VWA domain-containing protein [Gaiellaceae bacterium]|nr:VWA domain-containing protein [Gaiellaceae bacterium]
MDVSLVTPLGILFALTCALPLAALALRERRLRSVRRALGIAEPTLRSRAPVLAALVGVPLLLGLAATQPVVETTRTVNARTDVQAFVVLDVSRSMLASEAAGAPTRLERARVLASRLRQELPEVPIGIASLTDRALPHLFPTVDAQVFDATLQRAVDIEKPPSSSTYVTVATKLDALRSVPEKSYFPPTAKKRVLVVLTDGESQAVEGGLATAFELEPAIESVLVRIGDESEAIYETGVPEGGYTPDPRAPTTAARAAELMGGKVFRESDYPGALEAVRTAVGTGETVALEESADRLALMPWVTLLALVPLFVLLFRRNFWWGGRLPSRLRRPRTASGPEAAKVGAPRGVAQPG